MALWHYGWEFTQTDPTFPSYVLSSVQRIHPFLSRFILENKLLASVPCFQKMRLLFTNDLYFLTKSCRSLRSLFLFTFWLFNLISSLVYFNLIFFQFNLLFFYNLFQILFLIKFSSTYVQTKFLWIRHSDFHFNFTTCDNLVHLPIV